LKSKSWNEWGRWEYEEPPFFSEQMFVSRWLRSPPADKATYFNLN